MTVTRFAPSPTGFLHIGNLRTALMNRLIAAQQGGRFVLRLDDTDPERSMPEYAEAIEQDLTWLGLTWDTMIRQSDRLALYDAAADRLRASGRLYECFETPAELELKRRSQLAAGQPPVYDRAALRLTDEEKDALRAGRPGHWRFRLDPGRIEWKDGILGDVSIDASSVSDPVLIRGDGQYLYTLASVVDDHDMGITDIVRGSDHVTNTATQIQMFQALGGDVPRFAHHSLLTGPGGEALSKRLGTLALRDLREAGVEPMALVSLLARLGSSDPVVVQRSLGDVAEGFRIDAFGSAPTKFNPDDLAPLSARFLHEMEHDEVADDLAAIGVPPDQSAAFWKAIRGNIEKRSEIPEWWAICQGRFEPDVDAEDADFVRTAIAMLPDQPWDGNTWKTWTGAVKTETGRKGRGLFMPLRKALTGRSSGPDMSEFLPLLTRG
ncbi:glutamate--tRNA ligase [Amaricoccus tamworthensis]|uniref:glutamate--tRNA ligase n=1 Tax=Amaricoccus tamworthensis TaxID=57002 RepID=UPI003C7B2599